MNINNLQTDSRKVKNGDVFVALKGINSDGHDYINSAIEKGAIKIIASEKKEYLNDNIIEYVDDTSVYLQQLLVKEYLPYINQLKLIGVTGTNGKTTTCYLIYQMLKELNIKSAYIGTIGFYYNEHQRELNNTTPELLEMYKMLIETYNNNVTHVVMEVSSHALEQERIFGLKFIVAGFTNLTQDHLDYHGTMENYLNAKLKLLNYLEKNSKIIVNVDDDYSKYFLIENFVTIGKKDANFKIIKDEFLTNKTQIEFLYDQNKYSVTTNLISHFNVYNYLTALAITKQLGFSIEQIIKITNKIYPPKGRVESIEVNGGVAIIDYAHTPDAVSKIINAFLENKKGKIVTVIGCGGDRDPLKRPIMGNIASNLSDYVIFTNDNPRTENPDKIILDILKGVNKKNYTVEKDRKKAIFQGLELIKKNDVLLILGKGHEDYQEINHLKNHFSDKEVVFEYLKIN